ncbi:Uncharacterised protein [Mycobacteroides abscessus]|nr:Uncharacterised protein [Mycobacteroides abscessus]
MVRLFRVWVPYHRQRLAGRCRILQRGSRRPPRLLLHPLWCGRWRRLRVFGRRCRRHLLALRAQYLVLAGHRQRLLRVVLVRSLFRWRRLFLALLRSRLLVGVRCRRSGRICAPAEAVAPLRLLLPLVLRVDRLRRRILVAGLAHLVRCCRVQGRSGPL